MSELNRVINDRYSLQEKLGEGGMGTVYRGNDRQLTMSVAIKALKADIASATMIERFTREGEALRKLNHPNIVKILDTAEEDGQHYLIMEFVAGGSLQDVLEKKPMMPVKQVLEIALDLADALTRAHRLNIIHRDIKPANVLLDDAGTPRLTDFGIAHTTNSTITETGTVMGTTAYIAPEILQGEGAGTPADIWSFGVMLFEMLAGKHPFRADNPGALIFSIMTAPTPDLQELRPDCPLPLIDLVSRMLAKNPAERIPSVRLVGAELEAIIHERPYDTSERIIVSTNDEHTVLKSARFATPTPYYDTPKHNLPAQTTLFIGREQEVTATCEILLRDDVRMVTVTGPGGIGKTRLTLQIANRLRDSFADGVFFVSLAPVSDPESVSLAIASTLDIRQGGDRPPLESIKDFLQHKHMLLLLDNFEHVTAAATIITELLMAAPHLSVLVSSRRLLNLRGEHEFALSPLMMPSKDVQPSLDNLEQYEAVQLFINRAQAAKSNFDVTDENLPTLIAICHRLDGIPLAIELAAARVKLLQPENLITRLDSRLKLLTGGAKDLPTRQQTLQNTIDWSYSLLEDDERILFARLAVFVDSFSLESAEAVTNWDSNLDILTGVETLMNNSLVWQRQSKRGDTRFGMLETIREYALAKLAEAGEENHARQQHAHYFADEIGKNVQQGYSGEAMKWLAWCDDDHENLLAALNWSHTTAGGVEVGLQLISAMLWFWYRRGYLREGYDWCNKILADASDMGQTLPRGSGLGAGAGLATWIGDLDTAVKRVRESVAIYQAMEEGPGLAFAIMTQGVVLLNRGDEVAARSDFKMSLEMFKEFGIDWFAAISLMHLGNVELAMGDPSDAQAQHEEAHAIAQRVGDKWLIASVVNNLGEVARVQGEYEKALKFYKESEALYREMGDKGDLARLVHTRGYIALHQGDYHKAHSQFRESLDMFQILGNKRGIAECLAGFASLAGKQGQPERTVRLLGAAQAIMDASHAGWWPADRTEIAPILATAREALGEETFKQWKAEGEKMSLEDAVAYALS